MRRPGYGAWLRWILKLPGIFLSIAWGKGRPISPSPLVSEEAERLVRSSDRGNNYLALENDVRGFGTDQGWLGYAALNRTLLSPGGIHGPKRKKVLNEWIQEGRAKGFKQFLLFPVSMAERKELKEIGFESLHVGSEAIIDIPSFSLSGPSMRNLRQTVRRSNRDGSLRCREICVPSEFHLVKETFQQWLNSRIRGFRMRLLVGAPGFNNPQRRRVFSCFSNNEPVAFITLTPGWKGRGWGLDIMARAPDAPVGALEWLLTETLAALHGEGALYFSLGACPMRLTQPPEKGESPLLRWVFQKLYAGIFGGRLFRFRDLARFKEKFNPRWEPVYFGGFPKMSWIALYEGCRMWGLFDRPKLDSEDWP